MKEPLATGAFSRELCLNLEEALQREWLETNGLGGYASSTILDCHTRKYHGLLALPVPTTGEQQILLSKIEPVVVLDGKPFCLSTNKFPGVFHPTGHQYIESAQFLPYPEITYRIGETRLSRATLMPRGSQGILLRFTIKQGTQPLTLRLSPLLAYRNIHALTRANLGLRVRTFAEEHTWKIAPYETLPPLYFQATSGAIFHPGPDWIYNFEYLKERVRGFDYQEDLFSPGVFEVTLSADDTFFFAAGLDLPHRSLDRVWNDEVTRRRKRYVQSDAEPQQIQWLRGKSEDFLITTASDQPAIIAGYPWFGAWGRDAMIAIPGLRHCGVPTKTLLAIIETFADQAQNGLFPNYLNMDGTGAAYNSVDATLWGIAALQYLARDSAIRTKLCKAWYARIEDLLMAYATGTSGAVTCHHSGLLWAGTPDTQLTWMDATVDNAPVTPRHGYAVDINALWCNALAFYHEWAATLRQSPQAPLAAALAQLQRTFAATFWLPDVGYLADVVNEHGPDPAIRPNQLFAVALPAVPLSPKQRTSIIGTAREHLVTPYGLRTLSPRNPLYCKEYRGNPSARDRAYHQGTVWPWLVGAYVTAEKNCSTDWETTRTILLHQLHPLFYEHPTARALGGVSEVFDAAPPHRPKGAVSQAWSVAEVVRAWDLLQGKEPT